MTASPGETSREMNCRIAGCSIAFRISFTAVISVGRSRGSLRWFASITGGSSGALDFSQYCSVEYQADLRKNGISISMSGKGNCFDNAMVETFFKTLKAELVRRTIFQSRIEAASAIGRYIDGFYNPVRRHSALDFISPLQFEGRAA